MLYYDRTDISEGIDFTISNRSKEYMISHYWFFNHGLKFQDSLCNGCHDLTKVRVNISDFAIKTVKNFHYCCIIHKISKSVATNLLKNSFLENRVYTYIHTYIYIYIYIYYIYVYLYNIVLIFSLFKTVLYFLCLVYRKWLILWTSTSL